MPAALRAVRAAGALTGAVLRAVLGAFVATGLVRRVFAGLLALTGVVFARLLARPGFFSTAGSTAGLAAGAGGWAAGVRVGPAAAGLLTARALARVPGTARTSRTSRMVAGAVGTVFTGWRLVPVLARPLVTGLVSNLDVSARLVAGWFAAFGAVGVCAPSRAVGTGGRFVRPVAATVGVVNDLAGLTVGMPAAGATARRRGFGKRNGRLSTADEQAGRHEAARRGDADTRTHDVTTLHDIATECFSDSLIVAQPWSARLLRISTYSPAGRIGRAIGLDDSVGRQQHTVTTPELHDDGRHRITGRQAG